MANQTTISSNYSSTDVVESDVKFQILSKNPGKRAAEIYYLIFFMACLPLQALSMLNISYEHYNDVMLSSLGIFMGAGAWFGPLLFRAKADKGKPFYELYGFKMGCFLAIWAMVGGYFGTDPWYEVLHGHFGFNTEWNPNGVPFFMLPMTIAVFGLYSVILGSLFRISWYFCQKVSAIRMLPDWLVKLVLFILLSFLMPIVETVAYSSPNYCYDDATGMWFLNILIYGAWHLSALPWFTSFDEKPGINMPLKDYIVKGLATVTLILCIMEFHQVVVAPHFTEVIEGARYINDWSPDNCLGEHPLKK